MAELVERNIELSFADLQPMETNGICSHEEVIKILRRRRSYEYKLLRKPPRKGDYLSCIQYEVYLYMLFSKRKSNTPFSKCVYSAQRIHILFCRILKRFKSDLRLWLQYADFCKRARHYNRLNKCIVKALRIHPRCSGLWSLAAWTALNFDSDTHTARILLFNGIKMLPGDQHLRLQLCRLEILHIYKIQKRKEMLKLDFIGEKDDSSCNVEEMPYKEARLVYTDAIEHIPNDLAFRCQFIQLFRDYKGTESLQDLVYLGLREEFADDPMVWLHLPKQPVFRYMDTHDVEWNVALNACESDVEQIFEEGLIMFPMSAEIWEEYLQFKLEIISSVDALTYGERTQCLKQTVEKLVKSGVSSENIRTILTNFFKEGTLPQEYEFIKEIRDKTTSLKMDALIDVNLELFAQIVGNFRWDEDLVLMLSKDRVDSMLDQLYNWSLRYKFQSIGEVILKLFQWSAEYEPIQDFRSRYQKFLMRSSRKWPLELYLFCAGVEKESESIDKDRIDLLFDKMINLHGSDDVTVWLEYIEVKKLMKDFTGAGDCYWRAKKTLNPNLVEEFINRHTLSSLS